MKAGNESLQGENATKPELFDREAFGAELLRLYDEYVDAAQHAGIHTGHRGDNITPEERTLWKEKQKELYTKLVTEVALALGGNPDGGTVVANTEVVFFGYKEGRSSFLGDMSNALSRATFWSDVAMEVARMARTEKKS